MIPQTAVQYPTCTCILTSVCCYPDVVVRIRCISSRKDHQLRYDTTGVGDIQNVQRMPETSIPRRQRSRVQGVKVLKIKVAREVFPLPPCGSVRGAPHIPASVLIPEIICLIQLARAAHYPQCILENCRCMTCFVVQNRRWLCSIYWRSLPSARTNIYGIVSGGLPGLSVLP